MPKRTDLHSVMIIGSGPIVIGQACEFDYSGTQACKALREEGYRTILVNSNPATIMTDPEMADATYIEPLTVPVLEAIIARERPDALLPTMGGQTGLNLAVDLARAGVLERYGVELIGADAEAIDCAENREAFRTAMERMLDSEEDFERLNVEFDLWLGESHAHERIAPMVKRLQEEGLAEDSAGALIVHIAEPDDKTEIPPMMLLKSDGSVLYGTTDLATIEQRVEELGADMIFYVVDVRQSLHFQQVSRAARRTGIAPADKVVLEHLPNGTINGPDGRPFKTRAGDVPTLAEVMDMVVEKARERLEELETAQSYDEAERERIAELVGMAALKFGDLVNHRSTDYVFDLDRFTSFEGRTGPYLLYAAVRIKSILRRAAERGLEPGEILPPAGPQERELMVKLVQLPDVIEFAVETRAPNHIADYVYNLAILFNRFYREHHILSEPNPARQESWLALSAYTLAQLELGLGLLGIEIPERM